MAKKRFEERIAAQQPQPQVAQLSPADQQILALQQQINLLQQQKAYQQQSPIIQPQPAYQQQQQQIPQPPLPPDLQDKFTSGMVHKKVAALEVLRHLKLARIVGVGSIVGVFILMLLELFGKWPMYVGGFIFIVPAAIYTASVTKEINRLMAEYNLR